MKKKTYVGIAAAVIVIVIAAIILLLSPSFFKKDAVESLISSRQANGVPGKLFIRYPKEGTLFPPGLPSPTFTWKDETRKADTWVATAGVEGRIFYTSGLFDKPEWKPGAEEWENFKRLSTGKAVQITVLGFEAEKPGVLLSGDSVHIRTSTDKVGAPIFYRDVPLPFEYAYKHLDSIRWCLGDITSAEPPRVVLSGLPLCGNCHSFTRDGGTLAMDVDYASDKGSYVISGVAGEVLLTPDKIITWSDYRREDGQMTFGLLSRISPDGRYVLSTVKDRSIFVPKDDLHYSQLFFPIKGIICVYDTTTGKFRELPGADDPVYVQSNPTWSPDGKTIIFARAAAYHSEKAEKSGKVILPTSAAAEFIEGKKDFKYDLYSIPFNGGLGGRAGPLAGASGNGMSNYFPRFSPDGKWIVFCRAKNFMLLQPDSTLYIVPAGGGTARKMNCNTSDMNSWHSWSPNGKWLVFASKAYGPYTQLLLTHIDEKGLDTPGVLLESFILPERAVNIPEFVNIDVDGWHKIVDNFSGDAHYFVRTGEDKFFSGDYKGAVEVYTRALVQTPNSPDIYIKRADARAKAGNIQGALDDYEKALTLNPSLPTAYKNRGNVKFQQGEYRKAIEDYTKAIEIAPDNYEAYHRRGHARYRLKDYPGASADLKKALEIKPDEPSLYASRAFLRVNAGAFTDAIDDYSKAIEIKPDYWGAYIGRAETELRMENLEGAMKDYIKVLEKNPGSWKAHFGLGEVRFRMNDLGGAIAAFSEVIRLKPGHYRAYDSRANLKRHLGDLRGALKDMDEVLRLKGDDPQLYSHRGDLRYELKNLPGALEDYTSSLRLRPGDGRLLFKRGMTKILLGLKEDGLIDLRRARDFGYKDAEGMLRKYGGE